MGTKATRLVKEVDNSDSFWACSPPSPFKVGSIIRLLLFTTFLVFFIILLAKPEWGFPLYQIFGIDSNHTGGFIFSLLILGFLTFSMVGLTFTSTLKDAFWITFKGSVKTVKCGLQNMPGTISSAVRPGVV